MQFLLYARGGGGGEGFSIKFTMRHRSKVQPLNLLYIYTTFDREKVPLLHTLF